MSQAQDLEAARYGAGLELLARLSETGSALSGEEASDLLGTRTAKGIGAAFSGTSMSPERAGIRPGEAVGRRTVFAAACCGPRARASARRGRCWNGPAATG